MVHLADSSIEDLLNQMDTELDDYLRHFSSQSLCDGNKVRDCLLDIKSLISKAKLCKN